MPCLRRRVHRLHRGPTLAPHPSSQCSVLADRAAGGQASRETLETGNFSLTEVRRSQPTTDHTRRTSPLLYATRAMEEIDFSKFAITRDDLPSSPPLPVVFRKEVVLANSVKGLLAIKILSIEVSRGVGAKQEKRADLFAPRTGAGIGTTGVYLSRRPPSPPPVRHLVKISLVTPASHPTERSTVAARGATRPSC